jgi:hypothetical protein
MLIAIIMGAFVAWQFYLMLGALPETDGWYLVKTAMVLCVILAVFYLSP